MRISDGSSDVCSSDLLEAKCNYRLPGGVPLGYQSSPSFKKRAPARRSRGIAKPSMCAHSGAGTCWAWPNLPVRSEEHTSELQSLMRISYAVFCLKKKKKTEKKSNNKNKTRINS